MDEAHLIEAVRYIELNPVRAGLAGKAAEWRWSSAGRILKREVTGWFRWNRCLTG